MNHEAERNRERWDAMTPEQGVAVDRSRDRHSTPEPRQQATREIAANRPAIPPRRLPDDELLAALAALRLERERLGLTLAEVQALTRIDRATISKLERGELSNPTVGTLRTYAAALGKRLAWSLTDS